MGLFFAKRMRTTDVVTLPEYFRNRFGRATEVASSYLTIASFIILLAGNLVAIGFLLERFVGVSYAYGILLTIPWRCCTRSPAACSPASTPASRVSSSISSALSPW